MGVRLNLEVFGWWEGKKFEGKYAGAGPLPVGHIQDCEMLNGVSLWYREVMASTAGFAFAPNPTRGGIAGLKARLKTPEIRVPLSEGYPFAVRFDAVWYIFIAKTLETCLQWTTAIKSHIKPNPGYDTHPFHLFDYTLGVHKELRDERYSQPPLPKPLLLHCYLGVHQELRGGRWNPIPNQKSSFAYHTYTNRFRISASQATVRSRGHLPYAKS